MAEPKPGRTPVHVTESLARRIRDIPVQGGSVDGTVMGAAAPQDLGVSLPRVELYKLVRRQLQSPLQARVRGVFEDLPEEPGKDDMFGALRESGLLEQVVEYYHSIKQRSSDPKKIGLSVNYNVLATLAYGDMTKYLEDGDTLLPAGYAIKFARGMVPDRERLVRPEGLIVDQDGFIVSVASTIFFPTERNLIEAAEGVKEHVERFKQAGLCKGDPEILIYSPKSDTPITIPDSTVEHVTFDMTVDDLLDFTADRILGYRPDQIERRTGRRK